MEKQKNWEELVKWATLNDENRKEAIIEAAKFIELLTMNSGKKITEKELKSIQGGMVMHQAYYLSKHRMVK
jgi:bacteriocin-like protein